MDVVAGAAWSNTEIGLGSRTPDITTSLLDMKLMERHTSMLETPQLYLSVPGCGREQAALKQPIKYVPYLYF